MKVTRDKTENCQAFLTVEMEPHEVEEALQASYRRLVAKAKIPGFRRGRAPRAIVEHYIGKEGLLEDALDHLVPEAYDKAINEQEIKAVAQPQIEVAQTDPSVIFKAIVPLTPVVELGDYHNIGVKQEPAKTTGDDVTTVMEEIRHQHATWEPVERSTGFGDLAVLDIESEAEGKSLINQKGVQYQVISGSPAPLPGFAEQVVGMARGEEKDFKLKFPDDYPKKELAGKEASFKVKVVEVKEEKLPELDDELAKRVNPDFKTLDSLKERVLANLKLRAEEKARADFEEQVVEAVVGLARVEFPPVLVEAEIAQVLRDHSNRLSMEGKGLEEYLESVNKTEEELREELRPSATKKVTRSLVLEKVAGEEKIEVADAEIDAEIEKMTKSAADKKGKLQEILNTERSRESIKGMLITRKTVERLADIARSPDKAQTGGKEKKE